MLPEASAETVDMPCMVTLPASLVTWEVTLLLDERVRGTESYQKGLFCAPVQDNGSVQSRSVQFLLHSFY